MNAIETKIWMAERHAKRARDLLREAGGGLHAGRQCGLSQPEVGRGRAAPREMARRIASWIGAGGRAPVSLNRPEVDIIWSGMGGEMDSVRVEDDGERALTYALIGMIEGNVVSPGDTFEIRSVE